MRAQESNGMKLVDNSDALKWDRRRKNLRALLALKGISATKAATDAGVSLNTLNKFLRGDSKTMRWDTLEKICEVLELASPSVLDADNPFSDAKNKLYEMINQMSETEAQVFLDALNASEKLPSRR